MPNTHIRPSPKPTPNLSINMNPLHLCCTMLGYYLLGPYATGLHIVTACSQYSAVRRHHSHLPYMQPYEN